MVGSKSSVPWNGIRTPEKIIGLVFVNAEQWFLLGGPIYDVGKRNPVVVITDNGHQKVVRWAMVGVDWLGSRIRIGKNSLGSGFKGETDEQ
jgi:hypothetical protein